MEEKNIPPGSSEMMYLKDGLPDYNLKKIHEEAINHVIANYIKHDSHSCKLAAELLGISERQFYRILKKLQPPVKIQTEKQFVKMIRQGVWMDQFELQELSLNNKSLTK